MIDDFLDHDESVGRMHWVKIYRLEFGEFDRTNVQSNSPDSRLYIVD